MTVDPVIVAILIATLAVIGSVIYWNRQLSEQESLASYELQAAAAETKLELFEAQYNMTLFDTLTFPYIDEYNNIIKTKQHSDIQVHQILMRRAIDCIVKAHVIQQNANQISPLIQQQQAPAGTKERIQHAMEQIEHEIKTIQEEANKCKDGWGKGIMQQAADLSINLEARKQMAARQRIAELEAQQKQQEQSNAAANTTTSGVQPAITTTATSANTSTPQKLTAAQVKAFADAISSTPSTASAISSSAGKQDGSSEDKTATPTSASKASSANRLSGKKNRKSKHAM
jgi:hypothetical protein